MLISEHLYTKTSNKSYISYSIAAICKLGSRCYGEGKSKIRKQIRPESFTMRAKLKDRINYFCKM